VPELQVLIEIFIIAVSPDCSRQVDSIPSASPSAGGNNSQEVVLNQIARNAADAAGAGSFSLELDSPNDELDSVLNFIDSNQLGRVVSSPTTLVAAGKDAVVKRELLARVPGLDILDAESFC
jgi:type II secretory pathway component GspD/PulD (secretin)